MVGEVAKICVASQDSSKQWASYDMCFQIPRAAVAETGRSLALAASESSLLGEH